MEHVIDAIKNISNKISETQKKRIVVSNYVRSNNTSLGIIQETHPKQPDGLIAAVDGGIVSKSLHGMDIVLLRSGGVCFIYEKGKMKGVKHKPSKFPDYMPYVFDNVSDFDWRARANILRQTMEIERAIEMIEENPFMLLLDGSVVPHQAYRPHEDQKECMVMYKNMIGRYSDLYKKSMKKGIKLVGVVEDSRSRIICDMLSQVISGPDCSVLDVTRDTSLLFSMLEKGEKTVTFNYSKEPGNHPTLADLPEHAGKIHSFYLKTVPYDRPLRLDFLSDNPLADGDEIASIISSISNHHVSYGIPAPIIEADNISKVSEKEMSDFYSQILTMTGELPDIMRMRREQRPF